MLILVISQWVGIGFPMGAVAVILLMGSSYGLFEIKGIFIAGRILFSVGSALCGAAPTMDILIIGRVIAGIGGASAYLGALTYITKFASPSKPHLPESNFVIEVIHKLRHVLQRG